MTDKRDPRGDLQPGDVVLLPCEVQTVWSGKDRCIGLRPVGSQMRRRRWWWLMPDQIADAEIVKVAE